jgi:hypothetical protein
MYVSGTTVAAERTHYNLAIDANGHFEQQVPDGLYKLIVTCIVNYHGHRVPVELARLDDKESIDQSSEKGIVADYRVVMDGLKPGADPNSLGAYYGGTLSINDPKFMPDNLGTKIPGAKVQLLFEPQGPLLDGSVVQPFTLVADGNQIAFGAQFQRLPLGFYKVSATLILPSGQARPTLCSRKWDQGYAPAIEVWWEATTAQTDLRVDPKIYVQW